MNYRMIAVAVLVAALALTSSASAAPRAGAVSALQQTHTWTGATASGANTTWFGDFATKGGTCNSAGATTYCDDTLIKLDVLKTSGATQLKFRIQDFGKATDDFDLRVHRSDEYGTVGPYLGSPAGDIAMTSPLGSDDPRHTFIGDFETKVISDVRPGDYYLVRVVYFAVAESNYKGSVQILNLPPQPDPTPTPPPGS